MLRQRPLRDPRVEPLDPAPRSSDAYLHRAARVAVLLTVPAFAAADDWPQFRGPGGSGVSMERALPSDVAPEKNLAWRKDVPAGVSSPVIVGKRVFLSGLDGEDLAVLCLDAQTGDELWKRTISRSRHEKFHPRHGPATPTPASDGAALYVFLPELGLLAYSLDGDELWRAPLGPFTSVQGMAASPVHAEGKVVVLADQTVDAFLAAFDAKSGKELWRRERPTNFLGSYSTPLIYRPAGGPTQVIAAGSMELTSYQLETGETLWRNEGWVAPASSPSLGDGVVYASEPVNQAPPPFDGMAPLDADKDGALSREEAAAISGLVHLVDRIDGDYGNGDGKIDAPEWSKAFGAFSGFGGLRAVRLDGSGKEAWRFEKSLPYLPSALLYQGVLYSVNERGVVTALDAETGELLEQSRLREALGDYAASPVAGDGKIYFASLEGKVSVVKAGKDLQTLSTADLGESVQATPAISGGRLYVRTAKALYCFGAAG
jgi:outer membrane protein assembly factor BamB